MTECIKCNTTLEPAARFCDACGAQQPQPQSCKQCGQAMEPDARFCDACGTECGADISPAAEAPSPQPAAAGLMEQAHAAQPVPAEQSEQASATQPAPAARPAENVWQKTAEAKKQAEAANPKCLFYDGSLIKITNSAIKADLVIDDIVIDQWKSLSSITGIVLGKDPVLKAENYQFQNGTASIEVFYKTGTISAEFNVNVNTNGKVYPLGKFKVNALGMLSRETVDCSSYV